MAFLTAYRSKPSPNIIPRYNLADADLSILILLQVVPARSNGEKQTEKHEYLRKNSEEITTIDEQKCLKRSRRRYNTSK